MRPQGRGAALRTAVGSQGPCICAIPHADTSTQALTHVPVKHVYMYVSTLGVLPGPRGSSPVESSRENLRNKVPIFSSENKYLFSREPSDRGAG